MRLRTVVAGLLTAVALTPAVGTLDRPASATSRSSAGGIGIRLLEAPVAARADARAWTYIIDHLAPGSVIHRRVEVSNTTGSPKRLSLYTAAAQVRDRRFQFAADRTANELSTWTSTDRHEVTLAPHTRSAVTATIAVPDDAAPGERYAVIWAQAAKAAPPGGGVSEVNRVGIRIYLSVGRGNPPASDFTIDSLTAQRSPAGQQIILAQVHNTGGRALDLSGDLRLTNDSGNLSAGPFKVRTGTTLAPGDAGSVASVLNEQVPDGPWRARIRLESGLTRRTAEATVQFPAAGTAQAVRAEMDTSHYPMPALVGAVLAALAAITFLLIQRRRRSRREPSDA
ncbi:peptidase [Streptosporangium amethystogenes subsp. fukuiense]|uniref:Peptidase n=1 Tax=Streptosporangium amethystogenes subsp. fukuiense TaxID=698418 RepID=A0ABW2TA88_9ACTN